MMTKKRNVGRIIAVLVMGTAFFLTMAEVPAAHGAGPSLVDMGRVLQEDGTGRMWQKERSRRLRDYNEVVEYLTQLNSGRLSDWRLPTRQELYDFFLLFDLKKSGDANVRLEGAYWLMGDDGEPKIGSWEVGDQCGPSRIYRPGLSGYVRAVRP